MPVGAATYSEGSGPAPRSSPRSGRSSTTTATRPARATRAASRRASPRTRPRSRSSSGRSSGPATGRARTSRSRSTPRRAELVEEGSGGDGGATRYVLAKRGPDARVRRARRSLGRLGGPVPDRLDRGRPGRGRLVRLGRADRAGSATGSSSSATTCSSRTPNRIQRAIDETLRELRADQAQPDRDADRDDRGDRPRPARRLDGDRVASLRRDRGHDDRRSRRRDGHRPDQDRRAVAQRAGREVQPALADRGRAGRRRALPGPRGARPAAERRPSPGRPVEGGCRT